MVEIILCGRRVFDVVERSADRPDRVIASGLEKPDARVIADFIRMSPCGVTPAIAAWVVGEGASDVALTERLA